MSTNIAELSARSVQKLDPFQIVAAMEAQSARKTGHSVSCLSHALFANPNTDPSNSAFGTVVATKALPRRVRRRTYPPERASVTAHTRK